MPTPVADQLITRAKLSAQYRIARAYGGALAGAYAHARSAPAQGLLLDKAEDIQAEADRIGALYTRLRRFVQIAVEWGDWQLGQVVTFQYPRYGFDAGVKAIIVARRRDLIARTITLTLWC